MDFTLMHTESFRLISTNMYVSEQVYLRLRGGQGAPDIKVRAWRALVDLAGPDQPHPRPPPSPWPSSTLRLQALPELRQVTVVPIPATAVPLLSRRPHWLGL